MAVPTVVFLGPMVSVTSALTLVLFLTWPEIIIELSLRLILMLAMQAVAAALLCGGLAILSQLRLPRLTLVRLVEGVLTLGILNVALVLAIHPLKQALVGAVATSGFVKLSALAVEAVVVVWIGWERICEVFDNLNRRLEPVLLAPLLLIVPLLLSDLSIRRYDPMPVDPPFDASVPQTRPSIVLVTMDAFAAEDCLYGYRLPTTPNLERLARHSYNFTRFSSTSSFTTCAVSSLLTGMYPFSHRVFQLAGHLPDDLKEKNLPALLKQSGYTTGAIVTNPYAHPLHLRIGNAFTYLPNPPMSPWFTPSTSLLQVRHSLLFSNAFLDEKFPYVLLYVFAPAIGSFNHSPVVTEEAIFDSAKEFISSSPTPFFLWIHVFPPHFPYMVRAPFQGKFLKSNEFTTQQDFKAAPGPVWFSAAEQPTIDKLRLRYDEYLSEVDDQLGRFVEWLSHCPQASNIALVVTADHGENFRHYFTHASPDLRYPELHIPLLISLPRQTNGFVDARDADLTSVAPTILRLAGIAAPDWMEGRSLLPLEKRTAQSSFAMSLAQASVFAKTPARGAIAMTRGDYKYVWYFGSGRETLFDVSHDPEETDNLVQMHRDIAGEMRATVKQRFGKYPE